MRKRLIIITSLVMFLSLVMMLITSSIIIYNKNYNSYSNQITNLLGVTAKVFDGTNFDETIDTMKSSNVRITIIDLNGDVIKDSVDDIKENHKDRPELQANNLGKVFKRYSNTEKQDMLYVAGLDDGYLIRISLSMGNINQIISTYVSAGIIILVIIYLVALFLILFFSKKSMEKVVNKVNELGKLAKTNVNHSDLTIEELTSILDSLTNLLDERINEIELQMDKFKSVLDLLNQAIIVISKEGFVKLINNRSKELLVINDEVINNNYVFLFQDLSLQDLIKKALTENVNVETTKNIDNKVLYFALNYINNSWLDGGLIITIEDITEDYKLDKTKRDFFQNASHELKSPLTSIIGYEQLIVEGIVEDNEVKEYSKKVLMEARRMNNIIMDMLDLAALEQNYIIKKEEVNIKNIIYNVINSLDGRINDKNLKVQVNIENDIIIGDTKLIDELIRNLIDNAIKFNKENGSIIISFINGVLTVKDTGIGISKDNINRIFERFYCVDKGRNKNYNGTGLGLAIVKHICEINNYEINVESYLDIGTTFTIKIKEFN